MKAGWYIGLSRPREKYGRCRPSNVVHFIDEDNKTLCGKQFDYRMTSIARDHCKLCERKLLNG